MSFVKSRLAVLSTLLGVLSSSSVCHAQDHKELSWDISPLQSKQLTLTEAIETALRNNPEVSIANARLALAQADLAEEGARFLPSIQGRVSQALETLHNKNVMDTGVLLQQPLYYGGKLVAGKKIAQVNLVIREAGLERSYQNTVFVVTQTYYTVVASRLVVQAIEASLVRLQDHLRGLQRRMEKDLIAQVEVLKARTELARSESSLLEAKNNLRYAQSYLNTLLNLDPEDATNIPGVSDYVPLALTLTECHAIAKEQHPDFKQAELQIVSDREAVGVAAAELLPQINLFTDFDKRQDVFINKTELKAGVSGSWNIWDWMKTARTVDQFKAAVRESEASEQALRRDTQLAIRREYYRALTNQEQIELAKRVIATTRLEYQNQLLRFMHGQTTNTEVLDAQEALAKSEISYAESLGDSYIARASLANQMGVRDIAPWEKRGLELSDAELLDLVEKKSFLYFLEAQNSKTGLFRDASGGGDGSIAASGFGLAALCIGASRGWIDPHAARVKASLGIRAFLPEAEGGLGAAEGNWGFFFHFLDPATGKRAHDSELSTVDTALLVAGAITAGEYFGGEVAEYAGKLYSRVAWNRFLAPPGSNHTGTIGMGWHPRSGNLDAYWDSYTDETILLNLLAIGSSTQPVPPEVFYQWKREKGSYGGGPAFVCSYQGGLFTYQYAHLFFDFRGRKDADGIDWEQNSRDATLTGIRFCLDQQKKHKGFGKDAWGITSYHTPSGYVMSHGFSPTLSGLPLFDGTVAPSGPAGSLCFTPKESLAALRYFYRNHPKLWGPYGFRDSLNADNAWYSPLNFALGTGLTLLAIENYRSGLVWKCFMQNTRIQKAMALARVGGKQ